MLGVECAQKGFILMHTAASSATMKKENHLGMCKSKLGGPALKYINRSFDELCVVKAKTIVV